MENEQIARAFFMAYTSHRVDEMEALCTPGATFDYVPYGDQGKGTVKQEGVSTWSTLVEAFPDFKAVVQNTMTTVGGDVIVEAVLSGTQAKEVFGIPNSGKFQSCPHLFIMQFNAEGQISHFKGYWDNDTIYAQLNYTQMHN